MNTDEIYTAVLQRYSALSSTDGRPSAAYGKSIAQSFGYNESDLDTIPVESNLGLSCGNPLAIASLQEVRSHKLFPFMEVHVYSSKCRERLSLTLAREQALTYLRQRQKSAN